MVSLPIDLKAFRHWSAVRGVASDEGRALHHLLCEAFGRGTLKPFRLMVAPGARSATLYAYSAHDGETLRRTARETGPPEVIEIADPTRLAIKEMPGRWREGRRLAFDVRIRPVRRLSKRLEGWSRQGQRVQLLGQPVHAYNKGAEVDAFLIARMRQYPDGPPEQESDDLSREHVYCTWLEQRLEAAAAIHREKTRMTHFERRIAHWKRKRIEGPDAIFHGELTITEGANFAELLGKGVGRHKAFGYGMLLLRPVAGR